jgi:hypothetical protein
MENIVVKKKFLPPDRAAFLAGTSPYVEPPVLDSPSISGEGRALYTFTFGDSLDNIYIRIHAFRS